jgi:hypothetical protein
MSVMYLSGAVIVAVADVMLRDDPCFCFDDALVVDVGDRLGPLALARYSFRPSDDGSVASLLRLRERKKRSVMVVVCVVFNYFRRSTAIVTRLNTDFFKRFIWIDSRFISINSRLISIDSRINPWMLSRMLSRML